MRLNYPNDLWNARISYREVQRNHDPAVGFVERTNYRRVNPVVRFGPRPKSQPWIRQVAAELWYEYLNDTSNRMLGRSYRFTVMDLSLQSGDAVTVQISPTRERLDEPFRIAKGITLPPGSEYQYTRYLAKGTLADRRAVSGTASVEAGMFYTGCRRDVTATVNLRPRPGLFATVTTLFNDIDLPEGRVSARIVRAVLNNPFSPFVSLANNVQYDSVSRVLGWQFRFRWTLTPGNDVYFVALNNWIENAGRRFELLERNAATKVVYTRRF